MTKSMVKALAAFLIMASGILLASPITRAQEPVSFAGKTLTVIVGSPAGGGTDASARLIASLLASYLPGKPNALVRNIPGAQGITAMNYFVKQVVPDGLTLMSASTTQADPLLYRKPQSQYDPTTYAFVGGVGRGGTVMLIRKDAEPRLYDKRAMPVVMGALGGVPRSGMLTTAWGIEYLDWNAKWVVGYRGTNELLIALERNEIDMTSTGNLFQIQKFLQTGRFKILSQSGSLQKGRTVPRPEFGEAALFANLIKGKISDPNVQRAFDYWTTMTSLDKWIALPSRTPEAMVRTHRAAYEAASFGTDFVELGKRISEDLEPMGHDDVTFLIERLGGTTSEAVNAISVMLRRQGIESE